MCFDLHQLQLLDFYGLCVPLAQTQLWEAVSVLPPPHHFFQLMLKTAVLCMHV